MEINSGAPATASGELDIAASLEVVWDVISDIGAWPFWNPDVKSARLEGPLAVSSVFRWKAGRASLTSRLRVVDPPSELSWSGRTMGIRAIHIFRFEPSDGGTLARSEESWEGFVPTLLKGYSRRTLDRGIRSVLRLLKDEAERRAGA
ncbi:MAG: SRPBCC family protein [Actinomycetota bacterium]